MEAVLDTPRVEQQLAKLPFSCSTQSRSGASSRGLGFVEEREQVFQRLARGLPRDCHVTEASSKTTAAFAPGWIGQAEDELDPSTTIKWLARFPQNCSSSREARVSLAEVGAWIVVLFELLAAHLLGVCRFGQEIGAPL